MNQNKVGTDTTDPLYSRDRLRLAQKRPFLSHHDRPANAAKGQYLVYHDQSGRQDPTHSGQHLWLTHEGREYGFKQTKNELGWADYRVTDYASIERWWELVCCAYSLVSFQYLAIPGSEQEAPSEPAHEITPINRFPEHRWWGTGHGWKNMLNNLRLILQPYVYSCLLLPWLLVFDIPYLRTGFAELTALMNFFHASFPT